MHLRVTNLDGEAWGEAELDEVTETGEVSAGASHQVDDGGHLLHQREGVLFTHPQRPLKPEEQQDGAITRAPEKPQPAAPTLFWM